jgi:hypothetical protein
MLRTMEWWKLAEPWLTRIAVVVALLLSVANTAKLIRDARLSHRDEKTKAKTEGELRDLISHLEGQERIGTSFFLSGHSDVSSDLLEAAELGAKRGLLTIWWDRGQLHARLRREGER